MDFTHERFGKCALVELTQKHVEEFHRAMQGKENEPLSVWRGDSVRVAAEQGLLIEPAWKRDDVDTAVPAHVTWLSDCIAKHFAEALRVDPLS